MRILSFVLIAALLVPSVHAAYADLRFTVDEAGVVTTTGVTDVPALLGTSDAYTTKANSHWIINITTQPLDTFVYSIALPDGASVNYLSGKNARITTDGSTVVIKGSGEDGPLTVVVQYSIPVNTQASFGYLPLILVIVLLFALWFIVRGQRLRTARAIRSEKAQTKPETKAPSYLEGLPQRQQEIVTLLRKAGSTLTQRQIELTLKLPKSSISRNVEALRRRGIIEKASVGMTNTVVLSEKFRE